jgi:hypothetical protein
VTRQKQTSIVIGDIDVETDLASVREFAAAQDRSGEAFAEDVVPRIFPMKWLSEPPVRKELLARVIGLMAQSSVSIVYQRPLRLGARYRMTVEITDQTGRAVFTAVKAVVTEPGGDPVLVLTTDIHAVKVA